MVAFVMPKLGADMTAGKLVAWCKQPGDAVARGEVIAVIETDKVNVDAESFVTGVLDRILVEAHDEWLPVGTPLAVIRVAGEAADVVEPAAATPIGPVAPTVTAVLPKAADAAERAMKSLRISPAARKRVPTSAWIRRA